MSYSFWHSGILIGTSDLDHPGDPGQLAGIFHPTAHGVDIFPRLTGILSAGLELKTHLEANGLTAEELERGQVEELLETTSGGRKILDLGRMLCEVEVRAPNGKRVEVASIAFSDILELRRLTRDMRLDCANNLTDLPPDAPRYIVSATFRDDARRAKGDVRVIRRLWSSNN